MDLEQAVKYFTKWVFGLKTPNQRQFVHGLEHAPEVWAHHALDSEGVVYLIVPHKGTGCEAELEKLCEENNLFHLEPERDITFLAGFAAQNSRIWLDMILKLIDREAESGP